MELYEAKRRCGGRVAVEKCPENLNLERANTLAQMLHLAIGWAHTDEVGQINGKDLPILEDILYYDVTDDSGQLEFGLRTFLIHSYDPDELVFQIPDELFGDVDIFDLAAAIFQDMDDLVEKIYSREDLLARLSSEDGISIGKSVPARNARDAARMTAICMGNIPSFEEQESLEEISKRIKEIYNHSTADNTLKYTQRDTTEVTVDFGAMLGLIEQAYYAGKKSDGSNDAVAVIELMKQANSVRK